MAPGGLVLSRSSLELDADEDVTSAKPPVILATRPENGILRPAGQGTGLLQVDIDEIVCDLGGHLPTALSRTRQAHRLPYIHVVDEG
jgi:hypothetical protein